MINIRELIERDGLVRKFEGCAPEGFILVHENTLEDLKNFDTWLQWKNNEITIKEMNKNHFNNE